jgi:hypothetical protein
MNYNANAPLPYEPCAMMRAQKRKLQDNLHAYSSSFSSFLRLTSWDALCDWTVDP